MDKLLSILESLMPGKLPKALSVLTIAIAALLYNNAPAQQVAPTQLTKLQELAVQQAQSLFLLILGMVALIVSLIYEIHKIKSDVSKTQANILTLTRTLSLVGSFIEKETSRVKSRIAILRARITSKSTDCAAETLEEASSLLESHNSIEKISALFLRYVDSHEAQSQPVVQSNDK